MNKKLAAFKQPQSMAAFNNVPRQTMIGNQPHMLAYINPEEEALIQSQRGGMPAFEGPGGVPAYYSWDDFKSDIGIGSSTPSATTTSSNDDKPGFFDTISTGLSNIGNTISTGFSNTFGDQGYVEKFVDENIYDFDQDSNGTPVTITNNDNDNQTAVDTTTDVADSTQTEDLGVLDKLIPDTGENTLGQNIMNLASFLGDKTYVDGVEVDDERTLSEKFANLTLFDGAWYDSTGKLVEVATGDDLTGGGTAEGVFGPNYVYGVSDDFSNNAVDTTGMTDDEILVEDARMQMLEDIPPSMTSYFASFLPGMVIPYFGGMLGEEMLMSGIDERRAIFDQQIAALEGGATPIFNEAGEYTGYEGEAGTIDYDLSPQEQVMAGPSYDGGVGGSDDDNGTGTNDPVVNRLYNRFFISGSAAGLPAYMAKWVNGIDFDQTLEKVIIDGKVMYKNAEGAFLSEEDLSTALKYDATEEEIT